MIHQTVQGINKKNLASVPKSETIAAFTKITDASYKIIPVSIALVLTFSKLYLDSIVLSHRLDGDSIHAKSFTIGLYLFL